MSKLRLGGMLRAILIYTIRTTSNYGNPYLFTGRRVGILDSGSLKNSIQQKPLLRLPHWRIADTRPAWNYSKSTKAKPVWDSRTIQRRASIIITRDIYLPMVS
jgi:hypothetical protein